MTSRRKRPDVVSADLSRQNLLAVAQRRRSVLLAQARRHVGCRFLAEDVLQDAMLRILEGDVLADADIDVAESYLNRMIRNLAIDRARRLVFESRLFAEDLESGETIAAQGFCPAAAMQAHQTLRIVEDALQELPERVNTAFRLHRFDGVAQKDVAQALGVSRALVCEFVRRGHEHCVRALGDDFVSACAPNSARGPACAASGEQGRRYRAGRRFRQGAAGDHAVESP
jgi:RNA polymerase sigma-70 factor (ECF subfamily)